MTHALIPYFVNFAFLFVLLGGALYCVYSLVKDETQRDPNAPEKCPHCGGTDIRRIDVMFDYRNDSSEPDDFVITHSYGCRKCDTNVGSKPATHMTEEEFRKKYPFEYARSESGSWQVLV